MMTSFSIFFKIALFPFVEREVADHNSRLTARGIDSASSLLEIANFSSRPLLRRLKSATSYSFEIANFSSRPVAPISA